MRKILVLQSDFGIVDGAVSAMIGVALSVDDSLKIFDLSHSISPFNIHEASYRLLQSLQYWPEGSVFVSVVDPGVGSNRNSVVALTSQNHIVVTPNNGTLSHLKRFVGIEEVYEIDVLKHRRKGASNQSYTFDGRDLYAYIGGRLACGQLSLEDVGLRLGNDAIVELDLPTSIVKENAVYGSVEIYDERFGSLWTSILVEDFNQLDPELQTMFHTTIMHEGAIILDQNVLYGRAFNDVHKHELVLYVNSLNRMALALNQDSLVKRYAIGLGKEWTIRIERKQA
jgi:hypothetical protein